MNSLSRSSYTSWGLCILIMLFIFSPVLSTQETAQPGALYVIALVVPIFFMSMGNGLIKPKIINIYAIALFLFAILSTILSDLGHFRIGAYFKYMVLIIFFISANSLVFTPKQMKFSFKAYLGLSIVISVLIILSFIFGYAHNASDYYQGRYSVGITGVFKNPNYLVSFYNIAFFVICYILATVNLNTKRKIILYAILVMFVFSSYLTGTRAALMVEMLIILSITLVLAKNHRLYIVVPLVLLVGYVVVSYWDEINLITAYFLGERELLQDEGRSTAWELAFRYIERRPILGCGHNSWQSIHGTGALEWLHNVFLELILDQGVVGFLLFLGILLTGYRKTNKRDRSFLFLLLLFSTIPMIFQNGLYEVHFWRYIIINRLMMNFSESQVGGINAFLNGTFGTSAKRCEALLQIKNRKP